VFVQGLFMFCGLIRGYTNVLFVQKHPAHPGVSDFASFPAFLCDLAVAIHMVSLLKLLILLLLASLLLLPFSMLLVS
jgi:hypothetical protein